MRILNFASANIDYVYDVDHIVLPGETISAAAMEVFPGGKGLNQSIATARAGGCVYHAGFIGSDGDFLVEILRESGVHLDHVRRAEGKNGHAIIQVNSCAENCIVIYQGTNGMFTEAYIDSVLADFEAGDIVLLQNEINNLPYIIGKAWEKEMTIVLNPSPFDEKLKELELDRISYLILNETEARGFFSTEDPDEIVAFAKVRYPHLKLVLTLGKNGCVYADRGQVLSCPAFMVESVDTTAAGDCFTGYFVSQLAKGASCEQALRMASAASALTVSRKGAAPSIPAAWETEAALQTLKPYPSRCRNKQQMLRQRIEDYLRNDLPGANLETLAQRLGYSVPYTGALVRDLAGEPFSVLLQRKRCEEAALLLRTTDLPVEEIINRVGYKNESFFRKVFRQVYDKGLLEYRKQWTERR